MKRHTYTWIGVSFFTAIALVLVLTLLAERNPNYRHASFVRYFIDNPLTQLNALDLKYNSYYIAGSTAHHIYLGNTTAPLHLVTANIALTDTIHSTIHVPDFRYRSVLLKVDSPQFTLTDGTVPYIYTGTLADLVGRKVFDSIYFITAIPIPPNAYALVAMNNRENTLEKYTAGSRYAEIFQGLLEKQGEGMFSTDGMLHYDKQTARLLYLYFYRNEYLYMDTSFTLLYKGHTLDTVSRAKIEVGKTGEHTYAMAAPPLITNKRSSVSGHYLYNNSNLLARNDNIELFESGAAIDTYDLRTDEYKFSFYIPMYGQAKPTGFTVIENQWLAVLYGNQLVSYRLNFAGELKDFIAQ